jgi:hypothetical protein
MWVPLILLWLHIGDGQIQTPVATYSPSNLTSSAGTILFGTVAASTARQRRHLHY